jgi:anti-anti-sigma factor
VTSGSQDSEAVDGFAVEVDFAPGRALVSLRGAIDQQRAHDLASMLDALIERHRRIIILDLARVDALDVAGLGVITETAGRLRVLGGSLAVQSATPGVQHVLDGADLQNDASPGVIAPATLPRRPQATVGPFGLPTSIEMDSPEILANRVPGLPTLDDSVDATLRLIVTVARATLAHADGVSISLRRRGHLSTVAASNQTVLDMDANQYAANEGPCVDASLEGQWFHADTLERESRWPTFVPKAKALGINAILSAPLMAQDRPVGALNIYSTAPDAFTPEDRKLASVFATEASIILTDAWVLAGDGERHTRYQQALRGREIIAQAQGVLMERRGVTDEGAYGELRSHSQRTSKPLRSLAEDVLASTQRTRRDDGEEPTGGRLG